MYECKSLFLLFSLQKLPEDATPQKTKTGSAKQCEKKLKNEPLSVTAETLPGGLHWWILLKPEQQSSSVYWSKAVAGKEIGKRTFQKLLHHMSMSHNVRRLPRRLREKAAKEVCVCVCVCVYVCVCVHVSFRFLLVILAQYLRAHFLLSS